VQFEFDPQKSHSNKAKHGIDFVQARAIWKSKHVLLGAKDALERRYLEDKFDQCEDVLDYFDVRKAP
jgi:uncharacterized DUF497 family protein